MPTESQLKQQAKRLLAYLVPFTGPGFKYSNCLEAVARLHGARNWSTLLATADAPETALPVLPPNTLLHGKSGSGKTVTAKRIALAAYAAGTPLVVLDNGLGWRHQMELLEAEVYRVGFDGKGDTLSAPAHRVFNQPRLIDFTALPQTDAAPSLEKQALLRLREHLGTIPLTKNTLLVVDEQYYVFRQPALRDLVVSFIVKAHHQECRILVLTQMRDDLKDATALSFLEPVAVSSLQ